MKLVLRVVPLLAIAATGCTAHTNLPKGEAAYASFPPLNDSAKLRDYALGPYDVIAVQVFQEPELSVRDVQIDDGGKIVLPLIGPVEVAGKTTAALSKEIEQRYAQRYLRNPRVAVFVQNAVSRTVTVEGSVSSPGVFPIRGKTTLLDALALAKGTTRIAALKEVVVLRRIDGRQSGAAFDVNAIQKGEAPNPEILGNDTVVVGYSFLKAAWRDILLAAPLFNVFRPFVQ